ncbi:MAG TPA: isoamylase early set domain-containing protein [Gemmatimonadaceae bacterium]|nr:isoamylase early set domain-containing protein [Gemmatimonadaceae bacterium]
MRDEIEQDIEKIARELRVPVAVGRSLDARVMNAVRRLPRHARFGLWSRLITPRTVTVTPLVWGMLAATVAVFAVLGAMHAGADLDRAAKPIASALFPRSTAPARSQRVQFVLVAPDAKKVAVVGDFNGWDASHAAYQAEHRGGGVWSVTAPVPLGHHRYSFVVDDSLWVADPTAPRVIDYDYGMPNSAIVVQEEK